MKYLVTGATGQLGGLVVKHLLDRVAASDIAVSVRSPEKASGLTALGVDVRHGDFDDLALTTAAFRGVETVLIISAEADNATRIRQHRTAIDAAKAAGVGHVTYTSVVDPRPDSAFTYAAIHADTEQYLAASGLKYTVLRNSFYADLLLAGVPHALETGDYAAPAGQGRITYVPRNELALAAASVLANPADHVNKTYNLTGAKAVSYDEIAAMIASITGKEIRYVDLPPAVYSDILKSFGLPEHGVTAIVGLYEAARAGDYEPVSTDLATLLGRQPQSVQDFLTGALRN
ncbi:SDR family oxidoreductase [Thalassospira sp.]|uniref:SDR family oxidoreductase n=1 Tax=Thalassospira sp. TaxID=1912094 RepID=UPI0027344B1F|nr:SDR family oxidoreductase [Thalassospira sp.]MDP2696854.1 SDR family oxidoreductase [Thalassospira sp.]